MLAAIHLSLDPNGILVRTKEFVSDLVNQFRVDCQIGLGKSLHLRSLGILYVIDIVKEGVMSEVRSGVWSLKSDPAMLAEGNGQIEIATGSSNRRKRRVDNEITTDEFVSGPREDRFAGPVEIDPNRSYTPKLSLPPPGDSTRPFDVQHDPFDTSFNFIASVKLTEVTRCEPVGIVR